MKNIYLITCLLLILNQFSFSQNWQWIKQAGSVQSDVWAPAFQDNNDNIYVSGGTQGSTFYFGNDSLQNANGSLLAKYDVNGNEIWIKRIKSGNIGGRFIFDKTSDEIVLFGNFSGTLTFDSFSIGPILSEALFAAKFDIDGNCLWLKHISSSSQVYCIAGAVDDSSNIYIAPSTWSSYFGVQDTILAGGNIIKLDHNGNILWIKNTMSFSNVYFGSAISFYQMKIAKGFIYISGDTHEDTLTIDTVTLSTVNQFGVALTCFDMNANIQWLKFLAPPTGQGGNGLDIDSNGNIYTVGQSYTAAYFDNDSLVSPSYPSVFIVKLDSAGNYLWIKNIPVSTGNSNVRTCSTSLFGETYVTGYFNGNVVFGNDTFSSSDTSMFICRYNSNGILLGVRTFGEAATSYGVLTMNNESPVVGGKFKSSITVGSNTLTSYGNWDAFIAKLDAFTGIDPESRLASNQLLIYANPNNGKCNITVPNEFINEKKLVLSIYDNTGKIIQQKTLEMDEDKIKLSLDTEAKGVYVVTLSNGVKNYTGKIIFE